jgi:hypothetical protein
MRCILPFCELTPLTELDTMLPSTTTDPGHAVRPDGTLKDASEIEWTFDADEDIPFPTGSTPGELHSSGGHAPATVLGGTRQTTRIPCPSKRALEAAEVSSSRTKRKASTNRDQHVTCKIINEDNDDEADVNHNLTARDMDVSDYDGPSDLATEPADDYEAVEAMADADHQVCIIFGSRLCSHSLTCFPGSQSQALSSAYF